MEKDIIFVGGGPSGLSTSLHLAKDFPHLTNRILILKKEHYPRHKLCARGLVADAEIILERLGLDITEIPYVDVETAHFDFAGKGLSLRMPKKHAIRVIRRNEFDAWLAEKTKEKGIEIREDISVRNVQTYEDHVKVESDAGIFIAQDDKVTASLINPEGSLQI